MELTVLMPCLNEAETVATCVRKARRFLGEHDIDGEVLVADNGSTDGSQLLARDAGASVISIPDTGYGNAVLGGIAVAHGQFIIMGDSDDSYDFTALMPFLDQLRAGAELVMGNRFRGGIARGAMPPLHRYLGNPVLSAIGRLFFRSRHRGLPLRAARVPPGQRAAARPAGVWYGAGQRDGRQGHPGRAAGGRGADQAVPGTAAAARRTCAAGATGGGTCASCCCSARAGCSSSRVRCC